MVGNPNLSLHPFTSFFNHLFFLPIPGFFCRSTTDCHMSERIHWSSWASVFWTHPHPCTHTNQRRFQKGCVNHPNLSQWIVVQNLSWSRRKVAPRKYRHSNNCTFEIKYYANVLLTVTWPDEVKQTCVLKSSKWSKKYFRALVSLKKRHADDALVRGQLSNLFGQQLDRKTCHCCR